MKFDPLSDRGYLRMFLTIDYFPFSFFSSSIFRTSMLKKLAWIISDRSVRRKIKGVFFFNLGFIRVEVVKKGLVFK